MEPRIVGTMFVEVNGEDGYHGVVEIAMIERFTDEVEPGGIRDADTLGVVQRTPSLLRVREAIELAKWCYFNPSVFEGRVSSG